MTLPNYDNDNQEEDDDLDEELVEEIKNLIDEMNEYAKNHTNKTINIELEDQEEEDFEHSNLKESESLLSYKQTIKPEQMNTTGRRKRAKKRRRSGRCGGGFEKGNKGGGGGERDVLRGGYVFRATEILRSERL